jgi:hypothetical protein
MNIAFISAVISALGMESSTDCHLKPSKEQCDKISPFSSFSTSLTYSEWVNYMFEKVKGKCIFEMLFEGKKREKFLDQERRSLFLALMILVNPKITNVVLMDGHGRIILLLGVFLLWFVGEERINSLTIEVPDIDETVTLWHEYIGFNKMKSSKKNVFSFNVNYETFVYLNFLSACKEEIRKELIGWITKSVSKDQLLENNIMISSAVVRGSASKGHHYSKRLPRTLMAKKFLSTGWQSNYGEKKWIATKVSRNTYEVGKSGKFYTWCLAKNALLCKTKLTLTQFPNNVSDFGDYIRKELFSQLQMNEKISTTKQPPKKRQKRA